MEEKLKREEKNGLQVQDYLVRVEEQNRELKKQIKARVPTDPMNPDNIMETSKASSLNQNGVVAFPEHIQMEDVQRMNAVLMRAKDVLLKKQGYLKAKHEKKVTKLTDKIDHLNNKIAEQDKVRKACG